MKTWLSVLAAFGLFLCLSGTAWAGPDCHQAEHASAAAEVVEAAPAEAKQGGCAADGGCCATGACAAKQAKAAEDGAEAGACPCGRGKAQKDG